MTYTRVFNTGFEEGSTDIFDLNAPLIGTSNPKTGTYSIQATINTQYYWDNWSIPSTYMIRGGMDMRHGTGGGGTTNKSLFRIRSATADLIVIRLNSTGTGLKLKVAGTDQDDSDAVPIDEYYHLGFDVKIDGSSGWAKVYVNGIEVMSFTGNTGTAQITNCAIGPQSASGGDSLGALYIDNLYIDDSTGESVAVAPPILRFHWITPDSNGNYNDWTPSSGSGYQCVDEVPPSDSDYVETAASGNQDSYGCTTITLGTNETIEAVIPVVRAKREGASEKIKLGTRLSSTDSVGSEQGLGTSYAYLFERQTTKPGGGSWGQSDIDSVEVLIESSGSF
jgi:hypothetical protein